MAPTIGDILRITVKMSQALNDVQNVYHMKMDSGTAPSGGTLLSDVATFIDTIYSAISPLIADNVSFDSVRVDNITQDETYGEMGFPTLTVGGGSTQNMLPPQTSPLVLFNTAATNSIGKKFLPPVTGNVLEDDGTLTSSWLGAALSYANQVLAGMAPGTYSTSFGNYRSLVDLFIPYASAFVRDFFATQRRRYTGSGT